MAQVNDDYDELFDSWGRALNINPQLGKTVWWVESTHNPDAPNGSAGEIGGMQMKPETAAMLARKMGYDPRMVNLHDMGWAVPLAMQYLADGLTATGSAEGAFGYYNSGSADPNKWNQHTRDYINKAVESYPNMTLRLPQPPAPGASTQASP